MNYDLMLEFVKEKLEATDGIASKNPLHNFRNRYYHSKRVYEWCKRIHTDLECDLEVLYTAAIFHDVGRGVVRRILPGRREMSEKCPAWYWRMS